MNKFFPAVLAVCLTAVPRADAKMQPFPQPNNPTVDYKSVDPAAPPAEPLTMWYHQPALEWEWEALPIGNGPLGAMVFGGVDQERIQVNEETVWKGEHIDAHNPKALKALPKVRELMWEGKVSEATELATKTMVGNPRKIKSYQPLTDLLLDFPDPKVVSDYRRDLDLTTAINRTQYTVDGVSFVREVFVSAPDNVLVVRLTADKPGSINFSARFHREDAERKTVGDNRIVLQGKLNLTYEAQLVADVEGGSIKSNRDRLEIKDADAATLMLVGATSYINATDVSGDATARNEATLKAVERQVVRRHPQGPRGGPSGPVWPGRTRPG